ncbi:hypothetical protein AWU82_29790 [Pseudomonas glycinae]|uniref:Uncharacterized protein n=1 Tax=Pseudomonas glycinae TaxID=1785145 RepID=A0ABN5FNC1_9PSED|nr:hypothetical protein AWU82_29790 [Pseudomonas glycinae]
MSAYPKLLRLNLRRIDSAQYINRLNARDYDMIVTSFPRSGDPIVSPGRELYSLYASQSATQVGSSKMRSHWNLEFPEGPSKTTTLIGWVCKRCEALS